MKLKRENPYDGVELSELDRIAIERKKENRRTNVTMAIGSLIAIGLLAIFTVIGYEDAVKKEEFKSSRICVYEEGLHNVGITMKNNTTVFTLMSSSAPAGYEHTKQTFVVDKGSTYEINGYTNTSGIVIVGDSINRFGTPIEEIPLVTKAPLVLTPSTKK